MKVRASADEVIAKETGIAAFHLKLLPPFPAVGTRLTTLCSPGQLKAEGMVARRRKGNESDHPRKGFQEAATDPATTPTTIKAAVPTQYFVVT